VEELRRLLPELQFYPHSVQQFEGATLALAKLGEEKVLVVAGRKPPKLSGRVRKVDGKRIWICPTNSRNARALQSLLPFLQPKPSWLRPSVGFGDRLGLSTPGHIRAAKSLQVYPILAQQSARELRKTGRSFREVLECAIWGVFQEGYTGGFGSDADHLSTLGEIREAIRAGFTGFTLDVSPYLDYSEKNLLAKVSRWSSPTELERDYRRFEIIPGFELAFEKEEVWRLGARFARALNFVQKAWKLLSAEVGEFDFEISLDETQEPTAPKEHFFFVRELKLRGIRITSFAPKFIGKFEKAVDFKGDLDKLRENLRQHYLIAQHLGPYKLSIHSGSDKPSVYPLLAEFGPVHIKTSGTTYLQALELVQKHDPKLFSRICALAEEVFEKERKAYAGLVGEAREASLEGEGRQVLHVTYGSVLRRLGREIRRILIQHEEEFSSKLEQHFSALSPAFRREAGVSFKPEKI
jgi:hypothetical protein